MLPAMAEKIENTKKRIEELKDDKGWWQSQIKYCERYIANYQSELDDPSTSEWRREYLEKLVQDYEENIQTTKLQMERCATEIAAEIKKMKTENKACSSVKNRDGFDKAMDIFRLIYLALRCIMFGFAGVGKSHTLALILGENPPPIRVSTACAKTPVRAVAITRIGVDGKHLIRINVDEYSDMIMKTAKDYIAMFMPTGTIAGIQRFVRKAINAPAKPTDEVEKELITRFYKADEDVKLLKDQIVGEMGDCGGQPQFLEILPKFIDNLSLGILVTDLSQRFDDYPMNYYYNEEGESVGEGVKSTLTNEQIIRLCLRMIVSKSQGDRRVKVIFVGTHRDEEYKCSESREEKNCKLMDIVKSLSLEENVIYRNEDELIYALNAKNPEEVDHFTAGELREAIIDKSNAIAVHIPLNFYGVELTLQKMVQESNQIAFHEFEILPRVSHYHITEESLKDALRFLHEMNLVFYFEEEFPNVVIGHPQSILNKLTELVAYHIQLTTNPKMQRNLDGMWKKFSQCGILRIDCLKKFPDHYVNGVFSPADMMRLFMKLFIVSEVKEGEYLLPCVLNVDELTSCNPEPETQSVPPMVLYFAEGAPRYGVYCGTICHLITVSKWKLFKDPRTGEFANITRNSVHFSLPGYRGNCKVTINDPFDNFFLVTLHVPPDVPSYTETVSRICLKIHDTLVSAINEATKKLHYIPDEPVVSFLCEEHISSSFHPATISEIGDELLCTKHLTSGGPLTPQHRVWLKDPSSPQSPPINHTPSEPPQTPMKKTNLTSPRTSSINVTEFSEDLSSGDLYQYMLFKNVPQRDCDIIKEGEISGLCFLGLSEEDWKNCGLSRAGVIAVTKLQEKIKTAQTTTNSLSHVPDSSSLQFPPLDVSKPSIGDAPFLHQLEYLKVGSNQFKIINEVCYKWKEMALALEFDHHALGRIKYNTRNDDCVESCREVFSLWLDGEACQAVSWKRLIMALNVIEFGVLASELEQALSQS